MIFRMLISPVRFTCVPPHNSTDHAVRPLTSVGPPICTTRTSSPYFSPNRASAPSSIAASGVMIRVETFEFICTRLLTMACTRPSSSSDMALGWEKSNLKRSGPTIDPFCATCSPSTSRKASCRRCVAEWFARNRSRLVPSISRRTSLPISSDPLVIFARWTNMPMGVLKVSVTSATPSAQLITPVSPICPPDSA